MEEEKKGRQVFEGYHIAEDSEVQRALDEYKAADERVWQLTLDYLYPPEEVPYEGVRQLVFPNEAARNGYDEAKRIAKEARESYERIAQERGKQKDSS